MAKLNIIQESKLFQGLSAEEMQRLASIAREETCEAGQYVFREGERAQTLYILEEGKVILEMKIAPIPGRRLLPQATVDVATKGEILGWSALVEPHILNLSAQAVDRCKFIAIDGSQLLELMDSDHTMGYGIMKRLSAVIASRLTHTRQTLISERGLALLSQAYSY